MAARNEERSPGTGSNRPGRGGNWQKPNTYRLVLLGETAVGKSSLVMRFVKGEFKEFRESTIGAAFLTSTVCPDGRTVKFEIWDTAGQERFHSLAPMYYRGAQAALVLYDISSMNSLERAKAWVAELRKQVTTPILVVLAGNKADLADHRDVPIEEAQRYASENGLLFMETSAKTGFNVNEIFNLTARSLVQSQPHEGATQRSRGMNLTAQPAGEPAQPGRSTCCS